MTDLVTGANHGYALRQHQRSEEVPLLACTQFIDSAVRGRPFRSAIPRTIVIVAIAIILAISFIVFLVVRNEIGEREAVVRGDKIDAGGRRAPTRFVQIRTASQPRAE